MTTTAMRHWLDRTHAGDCRCLLRRVASDGVRVQMCVTSPPYFGLRSYLPDGHPDKPLEIGREGTPSEYIGRLVEAFRTVRAVLADDGTLWVVIGDSYNAGRNGGHAGGKKQAALARHSGIDRSGANEPGLKPKDMIGIPWMLAFALRRDGWYLRQDIVWAKPNPMPESVRDRCTRAHEYLFLLSKRPRYYFDNEAIRDPAVDPRAPGNIRPVRAPPGERVSSANANLRGGLHRIGIHATRNKRDVWTIPSTRFSGGHFAVFPDALAITCILAGSRPGDIVLDPFMGSGTTAVMATRLRRRFIGCELNRSFLDLRHLH